MAIQKPPIYDAKCVIVKESMRRKAVMLDSSKSTRNARITAKTINASTASFKLSWRVTTVFLETKKAFYKKYQSKTRKKTFPSLVLFMRLVSEVKVS